MNEDKKRQTEDEYQGPSHGKALEALDKTFKSFKTQKKSDS